MEKVKLEKRRENLSSSDDESEANSKKGNNEISTLSKEVIELL